MKTPITILLFFLFTKTAFSASAGTWNGYDYDNKTEIEIGQGNLVREGLTIQFYDSKYDDYHTAEIQSIQSIAGGTEIIVHDFDSKKDRILIMQDQN